MLDNKSKIMITVSVVSLIFFALFGLQKLSNRSTPLLDSNNWNASEEMQANASSISYSQSASPVGLPNLGNVCYMSSVLQVMFALIPEWIQSNTNKGALTQKFLHLNKNRDTATYVQFKREAQNSIQITKGYYQQDAHEFFTQLLNTLSQQNIKVDQNKKQSSGIQMIATQNSHKSTIVQSELQQLFKGELQANYHCQKGHKLTASVQPFTFLSVPIPAHQHTATVSQLLVMSLAPEQIDDGATCQKCGSGIPSKLAKTISVTKTPHYLVVQLLRFKQEADGSVAKINEKVLYTDNINLGLKFVDPKTKRQNNKNVKYRLIGTIHHWGSLNHGHYYAQVRDQQDIVYRLNDEQVQQVEFCKNEVKQSDSVYMLFYQRINRGASIN